MSVSKTTGRIAGHIIKAANTLLSAVPVGVVADPSLELPPDAQLVVAPASQRDTVRELEALRAAEPAIFRNVFDRPPRSTHGMQDRIRELQQKVLTNVRTGPARIAKAEARRARRAQRNLGGRV